MKKIKRNSIVLILISVVVCIFAFTNNGTSSKNIIFALKNGNVNELSSYFGNNVELVLINKENMCDKSKARELLTKFFLQHIPKNFILLHEGGKDAYHYTIGTLETSDGQFRIYFLIKSEENQDYIHQLRIENSND